MATAFELTRPEHAGRYEVVVYQLGWRLGGKGASGRGPAGRIEEHGLHLWMGFYENAFRLMRECYAELGRDPARCPIADWRQAFEPASEVAIVDRLADGNWLPWGALLPPSEGLPGDPFPEGTPRWGVGVYVKQAIAMVRTVLGTLGGVALSAATAPPTEPTGIVDRLRELVKYGELASLAALIEGVELLETLTGGYVRESDNVVLQFLDAVSRNARSQLEARASTDHGVRRAWTILDLTLATLRGIVRFGLLTDPRGFDTIDDYECREWLLLNGASEQTVDSGYVRGLYDLGFSYEDGDPTKPRISAGQAVRGMGRAFFTYRGAFFWKMQAGMGDVVFAPFYEVLQRRGVRFEFFHRLTNVHLADPATVEPGASPYVASLDFDVQARIRDDAEYRALVDVRGLPCWPSAADFDQLVDGERLRAEGREFESHWDTRREATKTLHVGRDFDLVVLAVSIGAVPFVCREIVARDARWRAMVDHVKTVATQAFQIWLSVDMEELGWKEGPVTLSGFVEPFETWADMAHLLPRENWLKPPGALAYFCSVLPDRDGPASAHPQHLTERRDEVRRNAIEFLNRDVVRLWPAAERAPGEFRWDTLVDPQDPYNVASAAAGSRRFGSQFWTANVSPSDRYVLSLPGSSKYRISPLDDTYDNLTIAGDWTDCGFNAGCVEAAVMSGRLAAHAIARVPSLDEIIGYDHP